MFNSSSIFNSIILFVFFSSSSIANENVFSSKSFWYKPIPQLVKLHPNTDNLNLEFNRQVKQYYGHVSINLYKYSSPVFYVDKATPLVRVKQWDCQKKGYLDKGLEVQWEKVPVPENASPAEGTDAEMTIYQKDTDTLWEFWVTRKQGVEWQACWGGSIVNVSKSDGIFRGSYGTTATGLPFLGGQITAEELKRGEINHVIGIALVDTESFKVFSWPAQRSDGYNPSNSANRIPEGLRFRIDPSVDIDKLNLHPVARTIAKAGQKYGFVVWDKAGAVTLRAENPLGYKAQGKSDPYVELWNGTPNWSLLNGIPWDRVQFLPMHFGRQD